METGDASVTAPLADHLAPPGELEETPVADLLDRMRLDGAGSLMQQVYRLLHGLIVNLHLMPNQALPEKDVAASLRCSKTPVREAFIRLAEEGLVDIVPKIGTFVAPIDIKRALQGYFIREALESACAERIASRGDNVAFARLRRELDHQARHLGPRDYDAFYILDNQFHATMFLVAGLPGAKRLVDSAKSEVDRVKGLKSVYRFCRPEEVLYDEHVAMYDAMRAGDGARARRAIKAHLSGMSDAIRAILKQENLWRLFTSINQGRRRARAPEVASAGRAAAGPGRR